MGLRLPGMLTGRQSDPIARLFVQLCTNVKSKIRIPDLVGRLNNPDWHGLLCSPMIDRVHGDEVASEGKM